MKSILVAPPRATRLTPRSILLTFIIFSLTTWLIYYLTPSRGWRKPPGREWHPAVYNPPPSLTPPWWTFGFGRHRKTREGRPPAHVHLPTDTSNDPLCKHLPGAEDVLVVIRTGATESRQKLPSHLKTTLKCIPHFTIFGDIEETVAGLAVHDALDDTTNSIKFSASDFELYREQLEAQRRGRRDFSHFLDSTETRGYAEDVALQKEDSRALKLDKWKFLPILEKALDRRGKAKWFVFIEADTAILWSNLLQWLRMLDEKKAWYLGSEVLEGEELFAHSGSGYILSNKAVRAAVDLVQRDQRRIDGLVMESARGDRVLGKVLSELDISLTKSWPLLQGQTPSTTEYSRQQWCHPAVSYHHMGKDNIKQLWDLEQRWIDDKPDGETILHRDVFNSVVSTFISRNPTASNWDNLSEDKILLPPEHPSNAKGQARESPTPTITLPTTPKQTLAVKAHHAHTSADACAEYCDVESQCLQWSYRGDGTCAIHYSVRLGAEQKEVIEERDFAGEGHDIIEVGRRKRKRKKSEMITSGWMTDRIDAWRRRLEPCGAHWVTGEKELDQDEDIYDHEEERRVR